MYALTLFITLTAFLLLGCSFSGNDFSSSLNVDVSPIASANAYQPDVMATWQWQLQGDVNNSYNVDIYDVDLFDTSTPEITALQDQGRKVICYFSAGSYEAWRSDAGTFSQVALGNNLDDWEGERWLDIRLSSVHRIMTTRLALAQSKGCDGVEPDNMDAYTNESGFTISANDQLAYNRFIANEAHKLDLSVGLKNDLEQIPDLVAYYDFAVNEQCFEFNECDALTPFIDAGKPVFNTEYKDEFVNDSEARTTLCDTANSLQFSTLILPLELDDSLRFSCI